MRQELSKFALAVTVLVWCSATIRMDAQVTATFEAVPSQTLPGIPVDFRLTLTSASGDPMTLENGAHLEVTTEGGATFFAALTDNGDPVWQPLVQSPAQASDSILIPAGTTRDIYWRVGCALEQPYFVDARLSLPGRYSLRMKLFPADPNAPAIWSNAVTFTIQQPQGADAAVWTMLLSRTAQLHQGFSAMDWAAQNQFAIADDIYKKYPTSRYLPYVACFKPGATEQERLRFIQTALALNPAGPIADRLRLSMASVHQFLASDARASLDADLAIAEMATARQIVKDVQTHSEYAFIRDEATGITASLSSDEYLRKYVADSLADRLASPSPQVIPLVDCVSVRKDGQLTARFGYRNIKDKTDTVEQGSSNAIDPSDAAKKLPTTFRSGTHTNAFHATSTGQPITWRLLGFNAVATKDTRPCGGNN